MALLISDECGAVGNNAALQLDAILPSTSVDLSDTLAALNLPLVVTQLAHVTVTESMHLRFCTLFAIGPQTRAAQALQWSSIPITGEPALRFHEWWSVIRAAKDKATWGRKLYTLESPLAATIALASDWSRIGYVIVASLNSQWTECLAVDELDPTLQDLVLLVQAHLEDPSASVDEPLWALVRPASA